MTTLLLVRHGPTEWTAERRLQGRTDVDLSPVGRAEARRLRTIVGEWMPRSAVVSPLSRARTTIGILTDLQPSLDERWAEAGLGEWEGRVPDEIGEDYTRWRAGEVQPPGGEAFAGLSERVALAVRDAALLPGPVLVVTHGGVIRAALAQLVGLTADRIEPVAAPSLTVVEVSPESGGARLSRFNVTA